MNATDRKFSVYIHERGKRPRKVGETTFDDLVKSQIEVDGRTYFWTSADLVDGTTTYSDYKPKALA